MAPLPGALSASAPSASSAQASGNAQQPASGPFALLLGQAPAPGGPGPAGADGPSGLAGDPAADLQEDLDLAPGEASLAVAMHAAPLADAPWPPAGLRGLFAAGAGGIESSADGALADGAQVRARALAPLAPAAGTATPPTLPAAFATDALAEAAALEVDGAEALAATAAREAAAAADGADPTPATFTLPLPPSPPGAREPAPLLATPLPPPDVRGGDFAERFGAQLQWMAGQDIGHARIRVTPHDLGPVEVVLQLDGDSIRAEFTSSHAETRQALEQGLPRLRDLLGEHGFQLAHAGVGGDAPPSRDEAPGTGTARAGGAGDGDPSSAPGGVTARTLRGLVDAYA